MLKNVKFIKPDRKINEKLTYNNVAPMFRKKFTLNKTDNAKIYVCGLGYGYYYINGKSVTEDKFTAPFSDYMKTLWYNTYDVTDLLIDGENVLSVWCGNGWYNEELETAWDFDKAVWRDVPKFALRLDVNGETVVTSDESWKCMSEGPVWFNALRSGEYFDSRKYDESWTTAEFDDSDWERAIVDTAPPTGIFRECLCEPIREHEIYNAIEVKKVGNTKYLFDIGRNISGYIRLETKGKNTDELTIRYAEEINPDCSLQYNNMERCYPNSEIQTDKFICSAKPLIWSPKFAYHGFRYIEISGITDIENINVSGVFVHQAVETRSEFECSDEMLNKLFEAGKNSVYSNMFYFLTDCPTREKLGWTNDSHSSMEQILLNFKAENVMEKWLQDIFDAMRNDGALPCIVPTAGWGFNWGNGPVSDGLLFELPYKIYKHTGNDKLLKKSLEYFDRYFEYLKTRASEDGFLRFGLGDWAPPIPAYGTENDVPGEFINALLLRKFYKIAALAAKCSGLSTACYDEKFEELTDKIKKAFINDKGLCVFNLQTAVAMLIYYDVYDDIKPLSNQLKELIEKNDFHHNCGIVGIRRLYLALNKCGLQEYAYKILTAKTFPSPVEWIENGATTLWEYWDCSIHEGSKNHHMFSDFMSWIIKTVVGINNSSTAFKRVDIKPYFFKELSMARGVCHTYSGTIEVFWEKSGEEVRIEINSPKDAEVFYNGCRLKEGKTVINEQLAEKNVIK